MRMVSRRSRSAAAAALSAPGLHKPFDAVIYSDGRFYSAFPSAVRRRSGELIVALRRAPERRRLGARGVSHTDANSQLMLVRSFDGGWSWTREPELVFAHPLCGSQDPCLLGLSDGTVLCASYLRIHAGAAARDNLPASVWLGEYAFHEGCRVRSRDGGRS